MQLTDHQIRSLSQFVDFLKSDDTIFLLKGAAGTGKTTLLKMFIEILDRQHCHYVLMAPTGRAALVLNDRTKCESSTIHRQIYSIDHAPVKMDDQWSFILKQNVDPTNTVYFVDEASMIADIYQDNELIRFGSGRLLYDLISYCNPSLTRRKIVFVGDNAQLPPVGQRISPAMDLQYLQHEYCLAAQETTLSEVVRQSTESGILKNAHKIRKALSAGSYTQFRIEPEADISALDLADFKATYYTSISGNPHSTVVITHSNSQALSYNLMVRELLFGVGQQEIRKGDLLMITRNNYCYDVELFNGTIVSVNHVEPQAEVGVAYVGRKRVEIRFRKITFTIKDQNISAYILEDFLLDKQGSLSSIHHKALWAYFEQRMAHLGIKPGSEEFKQQMKRDPYYNALQCKYGYASTCHKAQGGEWDNVIVSLDTFMGKYNATFFRWVYTALTRAKTKVWYMNSPSFSAIDQIKVKSIQMCPASKISYYTPAEVDWRDYRYEHILRLSHYISIHCEDNKNIPYQHRVIFTRDGEMCELSLWYNKNFYTNRTQTIKCTSKAFERICVDICKESLFVSTIPFQPKFPFQQELHNHILEIAQEVGCGITNVVQQDWSDVYYLKTNAEAAALEFYYNAKHIYTTVMPFSSLGDQDEILKNLLSKL